MRLAEHDYCTGCGACASVCPKQAIGWKDDDAGFPTPFIKEEACVSCGACERVCPALQPPETEPIRAAYAAQLKDDPETLQGSTSGALFTVFAREIFRRGGVVYGCVWTDDCRAELVRAETEDEIAPMRGSKYVWSRAYHIFPQVKADLDAGRNVLFVGLPCQVAGLKNYLRKEYENLVLLDFLCSGAPSPMALDKYLDTICKKEERPGLNLKFRDKNPYGLGVHITWRGHETPAVKKAEHLRNPYYYSFYTRLIDRESCYTCPYGGGDRAADLTMGDYWGVSKYHPEMKISDGVSALLVNSEKGEAMLAAVRDRLELLETKPEQIGAANNLFVARERKHTVPADRSGFFKLLATQDWPAAEKRYLHNYSRSIRILYEFLPPKISALLRKILK